MQREGRACRFLRCFFSSASISPPIATPGPGIAALVARVLGQGLGGIAPFIAGFVVGDLIWFAVAATGLAVLAHEFAGLFTAIRWAGVAYLLYLAWTMWRAPAHAAEIGPARAAPGGWRPFVGALSLTLGNPKVIVFFLSIMPLVVDLDALDSRDGDRNRGDDGLRAERGAADLRLRGQPGAQIVAFVARDENRQSRRGGRDGGRGAGDRGAVE